MAKKPKALIVGTGGREHALAWKFHNEGVGVIYTDCGDDKGYAPNAGMQQIATFAHTESLDEAAKLAKKEKVDLAVFGPEKYLVAGGVDIFTAAGVRAFGPTKAASQLEGSKVWTKRFLKENKIPTAGFQVFDSAENAQAYVKEQGRPLVVKADGLAAGKGVIICPALEDQLRAIDSIMVKKDFGDAGNQIVIEEMLKGEEASILVLVDGNNMCVLPSSQDHKRAKDNDEGPNTGGMGAYSPAPVVTDAVLEKVVKDILVPTVHGMNRKGIPYKGILYAGVMIDSIGQPYVLEFNVRAGDPEIQPLVMRMKTGLFEAAQLCIDGKLDTYTLETEDNAAHGVVMASVGYPGSYAKGKRITGLDAITDPNVFVFHAGTRKTEEGIVTDGGRVLCVTATGPDHKAASAAAYKAVKEVIQFEGGAMYRNDIGARAFNR